MEPRIDWSRGKATRVLNELGVSKPEDLHYLDILCMRRGVAVRPASLKNFEGALLRRERLIVYRESILELGRKRFTIAHELGHWEMHPNLNQVQACTVGDIEAYRGTAYEIEANMFAAELLMPESMISDQLMWESPTKSTALRLAEVFQTSFTASALRMVQFSRRPVFLAMSVDGRLKWFASSTSGRDYYFLQTGDQLSGDSLARYCTTDISEPTEPEVVESSAWFGRDRRNHEFAVYEESVELGDYGVTASIITIED